MRTHADAYSIFAILSWKPTFETKRTATMTASTRIRWFCLAAIARCTVGDEILVDTDVYPRDRITLAPPPLSEAVSVNLEVENSQMYALQDLYDAMNASASFNFQNWFLPSDDPLHTHYCNFTGVTCNEELYVLSLDLNETGLSGTIPHSVQNLERLGRFKVWMNNHHGTIPGAFGKMKNLEHLILGQNNFVGTISSELAGASSLRRLLVQSNKLSGTIPTALCKLSNLRVLDFSRNNDLTGTLPSCLSSLPNLREVRIRDAGLTGEIPSELCSLSEYGCDGIACSARTYQYPYGRQTSDSTHCLVCPTTSNLIGRTHCDVGTGETYMPSDSPTMSPSVFPSSSPSNDSPTTFPSHGPSSAPSLRPSNMPGMSPSTEPSSMPSMVPTMIPSGVPSVSTFPSNAPSFVPTTSSQPSLLSLSPTGRIEEPAEVPLANPTIGVTAPEPSSAPSLDTAARASAPSSQPSARPLNDAAAPSESPTILASRSSSLPSSDFIAGGLNQGGYENDGSPEKWTWGVVVVILCVASCCLLGIIIVARRRHGSESQQSDSIECLTDNDSSDSPATLTLEHIDPFSFPESRDDESSNDVEEGAHSRPRDTRAECTSIGALTSGDAETREHVLVSPFDLESEYELHITQSGIEFISVPRPPVPLTKAALSWHDENLSPQPPFRSWEEEFREVPSPSAVRGARREQKRVTFQEPLEEKYSSDDKWLLSLQTSTSSLASEDPPRPVADVPPPPPPEGDQIIERSPLGIRRKWLPVENFYPYE